MTGIENIYQKIRLYEHNHKIILANTSDIDVSRLVYSTYTMQVIDDEEGIAIVSSRPYYSIENIPAHTYPELEKLDRHEDGALFYVFEKVMWADGTVDENIRNIRIVSLSNYTMTFGSPFTGMTKISRDRTFIKADEGCEKRL
jgi:hypothetical protein